MVFKDEQLLMEAYKAIVKKNKSCGCPKDCDCKQRKDKEELEEAKKGKKEKPDFLDVNKNGNKKESLKKALKDKSLKEGSLTFRELYQSIIND